jgi:hypothetical protein
MDSGGVPISGKTVTFGLSTNLGGINLTSNSEISDIDGLVVARVNSGIISTPVRVTATTPGTTVLLTSQSSQLSITTGIPDQSDYSISATKLNIDGFNFDGSTTVITARLADHFKNPAPDGTTVNFTSEAGTIVGTCNTTGGACSSTLTSNGTRPSNGRVTVLAYAIGEETFIDKNGNGVADLVPNEMVDVNGNSTDLSDAWRDDNENGSHDVGELYVDLVAGAPYNGVPDGKYSGVLCNNTTPPPVGSSAGTCAASQTIYVRDSTVIVFCTNYPLITIPAITPSTTATYNVNVVDGHGNGMPVGTTVAFSITGTGASIPAGANFIYPNTNGCNSTRVGCPLSGTGSFGNIPVTITSGVSGLLTVTVTTPAPDAVVTTQSLAW